MNAYEEALTVKAIIVAAFFTGGILGIILGCLIGLLGKIGA